MSDAINKTVPIIPRPDQVPNLGPGSESVMVYMMAGCRIIVSRDIGTWHLSISRRDRLPSYRELVTARYRLLSGVPEMAMFFPPMSEFVNVHPFTIHLYEVQR